MIIKRKKELVLPYNKENILKYKSSNNLLKHARFIPGKTEGVFLVNSKDNSLIGYCGWEGDWIIALEVSKNYRGLGYGEKLLNMAILNGCTGLTVDNNNIPAINLYKKRGFVVTLNNGKRSNMRLWQHID